MSVVRRSSALLPLILLGLTSCHGAGGSSALPAAVGAGSAATSQQPQNGTASFTVSVPATPVSGAIPRSVVITLVGGTVKLSPLTMNLSASTVGCKAMIGGGVTCVATFTAPVGTNAFQVDTYSGSNGTGSKIASNQAKASVQPFSKSACAPTRHDLAILQGGH